MALELPCLRPPLLALLPQPERLLPPLAPRLLPHPLLPLPSNPFLSLVPFRPFLTIP